MDEIDVVAGSSWRGKLRQVLSYELVDLPHLERNQKQQAQDGARSGE
jgi:hypothetical protein